MGLFLKGLGNLNFLQNPLIFLFGLCPILFFFFLFFLCLHWAQVTINKYLGKIPSCSCIVLRVSGLYAHYVFNEMPKWHFVVFLGSDEYQTLGITMFLQSQHVLNIGCVFYGL